MYSSTYININPYELLNKKRQNNNSNDVEKNIKNDNLVEIKYSNFQIFRDNVDVPKKIVISKTLLYKADCLQMIKILNQNINFKNNNNVDKNIILITLKNENSQFYTYLEKNYNELVYFSHKKLKESLLFIIDLKLLEGTGRHRFKANLFSCILLNIFNSLKLEKINLSSFLNYSKEIIMIKFLKDLQTLFIDVNQESKKEILHKMGLADILDLALQNIENFINSKCETKKCEYFIFLFKDTNIVEDIDIYNYEDKKMLSVCFDVNDQSKNIGINLQKKFWSEYLYYFQKSFFCDIIVSGDLINFNNDSFNKKELLTSLTTI